MKLAYSAAFLAAMILGVYLFMDEEAARPGALSVFHEGMACDYCHVPWQGVSDRMCLQCHAFADGEVLKPQIRFHEAEKHCLKCHREHRGSDANISMVDHALFSGKLQCTRCHVDMHDGLFGSQCRACHGIKKWDLPGFRHPSEDKRNCNRCHQAPYSHREKEFWEKIEETHGRSLQNIPSEECWRCHTTHYWQHLIIPHRIEDKLR